MEINGRNNYSIRKATMEDIPLLVSHHSLMIREMNTLQGKDIPTKKYTKMEEAQIDKLQNDMPKESCHAWIAEHIDKTAVASGAISIYSFCATPENPTYIAAYLHSIYTEKQHRGNKLSTRIIHEAISFCRDKGISRMILIASDAGKPIYETLGFKPSCTFMSLTF